MMMLLSAFAHAQASVVDIAWAESLPSCLEFLYYKKNYQIYIQPLHCCIPAWNWLLLPSDIWWIQPFLRPPFSLLCVSGLKWSLEKQLPIWVYHVNSSGFPYDKHVLGHIQRTEELRGTISKYSQDTRPSFLPWSPCQKLVRLALLLPSMYLWLGRSRQ